MSETIRKRVLPAGWYPGNNRETTKILEEWKEEWNAKFEDTAKKGIAAVVPHAGWAFSGKLAFGAILKLREECDTIVVVGGHLHGGEGVLGAPEDAYETPFGPLEADHEYIEALAGILENEKKLPLSSDQVPDNTVEVNLPFVKYLYPKSRAVWLRVGEGEEAEALGEACAKAADQLGRSICVIGSTDLTHYGPSYGFTPVGTGTEAFRWVRDENDAAIVEAMLDMDTREVLRHGREDKAACSSGAAAAAIRYGRARGVERGELIAYSSSYELHPGDSFVGYAGIVYNSG